MSSRYGRISEADDLDRYYTPRWALDLLLESIERQIWGSIVAEPCAGQGHLVEPLKESGRIVHAGDIDPRSPYPTRDATDAEHVQTAYDVCTSVITNPPYSADTATAFEVLETVTGLQVPTAMLLRLSFLEPPAQGDRKACYLEEDSHLEPHRVIVLPRVNYDGPGGGDANPATSCWVIWRPDLDERGETTIEWRTIEDRERVEGQPSMLEGGA